MTAVAPPLIQGPSVTDQQLFIAVRAFLLLLVPSSVEIIQGQINRVPPPASTDYVVMFPLFREPMSTALQTYSSPDAGPDGTVTYEISTKVTIQLDVHGPNSGNTAQQIATLWANYGFDSIQAQSFAIAPLYVNDLRQAPFITGEQQYDTRWIVDVVLEANSAATAPQQFALELALTAPPNMPGWVTPGLIDVDVVFPPTDGSVGTISLAATVAAQSF